MLRAILNLPFLVILMGISALMMLVPMAHAVRISDFATARVFLQSALLFLVLSGLIGVAMVNYAPRSSAHSHLVALLSAFVVLPLILAWPMRFLVPDTSYLNLYFEMVSSLTTTGASFFDDPARLSEPLHLWRAFVGWVGGLLILVSAVAIFAPLNLGGFEVYAARQSAQLAGGMARIQTADTSARLVSYSLRIAPVYALATLVLMVGLVLAGERSFRAFVLAMSTMSTSGITAGHGIEYAASGYMGEILIFVFLMFALSRLTFSFDRGISVFRAIWQDHEFRLAMAFVSILPALMFLRHWIGAFEVDEQQNAMAALHALWGSVFTTLSFLTTTGFESAHWDDAQNWSGVSTPGIMLIGLAVMGGGVATTAGGIKLLRVYALYKHGRREMQKLSYPSSVGGAGKTARHIRREGAYISWLFFMLFAISTALVMLALAFTGLDFDQNLTFAVSALSTTGPLADSVLGVAGSYAELDDAARAILCAAMVLGRLETLAIIALLNPDFWR